MCVRTLLPIAFHFFCFDLFFCLHRSSPFPFCNARQPAVQCKQVKRVRACVCVCVWGGGNSFTETGVGYLHSQSALLGLKRHVMGFVEKRNKNNSKSRREQDLSEYHQFVCSTPHHPPHLCSWRWELDKVVANDRRVSFQCLVQVPNRGGI